MGKATVKAWKKMYLDETVLEAGLRRVGWLYDEFECPVVQVSGGKDSTVILELAIMAARERGRLPVDAMFIDQEAEWACTIDHIRHTAGRPEVRLHWYQIPIRISSAASSTDAWLYCWRDGDEWMRPKEPGAIHENTLGADRFTDVFPAARRQIAAGRSVCGVAGVRCQESPARYMGLTHGNVHKGVTWGSKAENPRVFYPIYDWAFTDVWKAIHDHGWAYCALYDRLWQYGQDNAHMRLSSLHHETAIPAMRMLQEIEPDTWAKLIGRLHGVNTVNQMQEDWLPSGELPWMFDSWGEYRDHLLTNVVEDAGIRDTMAGQFVQQERYIHPFFHDDLHKVQCRWILTNDFTEVHWSTWLAANWKKQRTMYDGRTKGNLGLAGITTGQSRGNRGVADGDARDAPMPGAPG